MKKIILNEEKQIQKEKTKTKDMKLLDQENINLEKEGNRFVSKKLKKFKVDFASNVNEESLMTLTKDNYLLKMNFLGKKQRMHKAINAIGKINNNQVTYEDIEKGINLNYKCEESKIKESIIIKEKQESYDYEFTLDIGGLTPIFNEKENTLELKNDKKVVYKILSPYMEDANGNRSEECSYEIEENKNILTLHLHCDNKWINEEGRVLPIVIDPTIEVVNNDIITIEQYRDNSKVSISNNGFSIGTIKKETLSLETTDFLKISLDNLINQNNYQSMYLLFKIKGNGVKGVLKVKNGKNVLLTLNIKNGDDSVYVDISNIIAKNIYEFMIYFESQNNEYLNFYTFDDEEKNKPAIVFNDFKYDLKKIRKYNYKNYEIERSGVLKVNTYDQSFLHEHYDATINDNGLSIDLKHIYDRKSNDENHLGNKIRTNFHQYLKKTEDFNQLLGCKDVTYIDDQGVSHELYEKWYYLDADKKKHYIEKEKIFLDLDNKLKTFIEDKLYEVEYEVKSEEELEYISSSSLFNCSKKVEQDPVVIIQLANCILKVELINDYIVPRFDDKFFHNTIKYEDVVRNEDGTFETINGRKIEVKELSLQINLDNNGLYFAVPFLVEKDNAEDNGTHLEEEIYKEYVKVEYSNYPSKIKNYIETEEIQKINNQIEVYKNNLNDLYDSGSEINLKIKEMQQTILLQRECDNLNKKYETQHKRFFKKNGLGTDFINTKINNDSDYFKYDPENLTLDLCDTLDSDKESEKEKHLNTIELYLKRLSYDANIQIGELKDSLKMNSSSYEVGVYNKQLDSLEEKKKILIQKVKEVLLSLNALEVQKKTLIEEQKKQVNDLLVDKQGNTLGFDGYGRLILIQDKFENKINVEYGYEEENKDKILSIYSEHQNIRFTYNKETGLLESILDQRGRITKYKYDNNQNLNEIIYNDKTKTTITNYYDSNTEIDTYEITSPNLRKLKWELDEDGFVTIYKYVYDGTISSSKINNPQVNKLILKDYYDVDTDPDYTAITDIKGKTKKVYFDNQGREIKYIKDEDVEVINYSFNNVLNRARFKKANIKETLNNCIVDELYSFEKISNGLYGLYFKAYEYAYFSININVIITYNDNTTLTFNQKQYDLYVSDIVIPLFKNGKKITKVQFKFSSIQNTLSPMDVSLVKLEEATTYTYDVFKKLIKEQNQDKTITYSDFNDNDIPLTVKEEDNFNNEVITHYSYNDKNLLTYVEDSKLNVQEYYYDELGNCIEQQSYNKKDASLKHVEKVSYDEKGRPKSSLGLIKDTKGNYPSKEITYLSGTNIESKIKGFNNEVTTYGYDYNTDELISIASSVKGINNSTSFTYNYGLLTSMSHHGVKVDYEYDGLGRKTKISLNGEEYIRYEYGSNYKNNELYIYQGDYQEATYKNGLTILFAEDINKETKGEVITYEDVKINKEYVYNTDEDLEDINTSIYRNGDLIDQKYICYCYNKPHQVNNYYTYYKENNKYIYVLDIEYEYDNLDRLTLESINLDDYSYTYSNNYIYGNDNNLLSIEIKKDDGNLLFTNNYDYDVLNRVKHQTTILNNIEICHEYSYLQQDENTLDLISEDITKIKIQNENQTTYLIDTSSYEYDVNGNIISIDSDDSKTKYEYDDLNRLVKEDNPLFTKIYKYDKAGNIILKKTYDKKQKGTKVDEYIYDCEKRDQLIRFNNQEISYDTMGRPIVYKDKEYKWNTLNQLEEIPALNVKYEYDINGIRNKKIINNQETSYILEGSKIHQIKTSIYKLTIKYALNKAIGFVYNDNSINKTYIYQRNILGDIIGIFDEEGNQVAKYEYDSYGKCTISSEYKDSEIAKINPLRYRGYYYDEETQLYWVSSRYYSPELCRWISPDSIEYLDPESINGLNLYAYCGNDPVNRFDPTGHSWESFWNGVGDWFSDNWVKLAIGAGVVIVGAIVTAATCGTGLGFFATFGGALLTSAKAVAISTAVSAGIGLAVGGITTGSWEGALDGMLDGIADGFMWGGIFAGGAQILSGAFKAYAQVANHYNKLAAVKKSPFFSPDRLKSATEIAKIAKKGQSFYDYGGTIVRFGRFAHIDASTKSLLHLAAFGFNHIPIGTIAAGFIGGF